MRLAGPWWKLSTRSLPSADHAVVYTEHPRYPIHPEKDTQPSLSCRGKLPLVLLRETQRGWSPSIDLAQPRKVRVPWGFSGRRQGGHASLRLLRKGTRSPDREGESPRRSTVGVPALCPSRGRNAVGPSAVWHSPGEPSRGTQSDNLMDRVGCSKFQNSGPDDNRSTPGQVSAADPLSGRRLPAGLPDT
jgi:hypothetical protein